MATDRPRGFVHPKPRGQVTLVEGVPGVSIHTTGDGIVTVQRDLMLPFPEHDLELQPGEKLAQIVGTLLSVLHRPSPPSGRSIIEGVSWPTSREDEIIVACGGGAVGDADAAVGLDPQGQVLKVMLDVFAGSRVFRSHALSLSRGLCLSRQLPRIETTIPVVLTNT